MNARSGMQVPADGRTLPALLTRRAELSGDRDLLRVGDHARSAAFMAVRASRLAGAFASRGVRAGDRVAVLSESRVEVIDALAACGWLGASLVPINTAARGPQLTHILTNAAPRVLVAEAALLDRALFMVDPDTHAAFLARLDAPPKPNDRLRRTIETPPPWA